MDAYKEKVEKRFNRIVCFFYCLLIISLPVSIALVESMAGFVIFFFVLKKILLCRGHIQGKRLAEAFSIIASCFYPQGHFLNKWIGLYVLAVLISVVLSQYPVVSWIAFVAKLLEGYFLYYSFVDCIKTKEALRNCIWTFVLTYFVVALDGIFQYFFQRDFLRQLPLVCQRVSASLRHANDFGGYLIVFVPVVFGLLTLPWQRSVSLVEEWRQSRLGTGTLSKILLGAAFIMMLICLGLTFSRGSWVGFWISLLVVALIIRKYFIPVVLIGLVFVGAFLPLMIEYRDVSFTTDSIRFKKRYGNIDPSSEAFKQLSEDDRNNVRRAHRIELGMGRIGFWEEAWGVIQKFPFFGCGLNTYSKFTKYYAHNCYLQMAAEIGSVGLVFFLAMMGVFLAKSIRACNGMSFAFPKVVLGGGIAGLIGFMVQSFFDTTLYSVQLGNLMWIIMGLLAAAQGIYRKVE